MVRRQLEIVFSGIAFLLVVLLGLLMERARAQPFNSSVTEFRADGEWCPMAHCNRNLDNYQRVRPLMTLHSSRTIGDGIASPRATILLGCATGQRFAVCAYDSADYPALVAYGYPDGRILWTSPFEDLPGDDRRRPVAGLLIGKMRVEAGPEETYVFAANPTEFVAYTAAGARLWKVLATGISPDASEGVGRPISISYTDDRELVTTTDRGWIVKLSPVDGSTIDAYRMETNVFVNGKLYRGIFTTTNSPNVVANIMYLLVEFNPDDPTSLPTEQRPVHIVRIELSQPGVPGSEHRIKPLVLPLSPTDATPDRAPIGVNRGGGSPPSIAFSDGRVLVFGDADALVSGQLHPVIAAVEDVNGVLSIRWRSLLLDSERDDIFASPSLHSETKTLVVITGNRLYVFRRVESLTGEVPPPTPLDSSSLITCSVRGGRVAASMKVGSPVSLALSQASDELIAYTNFRVRYFPKGKTYGFIGAFAIPIGATESARSLWCQPLSVDDQGRAAPGLGTFGPPALFEDSTGGSDETGLILNTFSTGTFLFIGGD